MVGRRIDPPKLKDGDDYDEWAREIEIWQMVTDVPVEKQGALIYLSLEGQARECCKSVETAKLKGENGVAELLTKLKELFAKDSEQAAFQAYEQFETFMRPEGMGMVDFINEWERRYAKIKEKQMELPDGVLAYRLLKSANISEIKQTMVRTSIGKLGVDDVKKQLKAVNDTTLSGLAKDFQGLGIKHEPAYIGEYEDDEHSTYYSFDKGRRNWSRGRGRFGRGRGNNGNRPSKEKSEEKDIKKKKGLNPPNRSGNPSRCAICESVMHWVSDCPHREEENISLFAKGVPDSYSSTFVAETFNSTLLDSGCSKTVCGSGWYNSYLAALPEIETKNIIEQESNSSFKFGSGTVFASLKKQKYLL